MWFVYAYMCNIYAYINYRYMYIAEISSCVLYIEIGAETSCSFLFLFLLAFLSNVLTAPTIHAVNAVLFSVPFVQP